MSLRISKSSYAKISRKAATPYLEDPPPEENFPQNYQTLIRAIQNDGDLRRQLFEANVRANLEMQRLKNLSYEVTEYLVGNYSEAPVNLIIHIDLVRQNNEEEQYDYVLGTNIPRTIRDIYEPLSLYLISIQALLMVSIRVFDNINTGLHEAYDQYKAGNYIRASRIISRLGTNLSTAMHGNNGQRGLRDDFKSFMENLFERMSFDPQEMWEAKLYEEAVGVFDGEAVAQEQMKNVRQALHNYYQGSFIYCLSQMPRFDFIRWDKTTPEVEEATEHDVSSLIVAVDRNKLIQWYANNRDKMRALLDALVRFYPE